MSLLTKKDIEKYFAEINRRLNLLGKYGGDSMVTRYSDDYISNRAWFRDVVKEDVILRGVSALEYLQLFVGYVNEKNIDVYSKKKGKYRNINYVVVKDFTGIDYFQDGNILCSSFNQAINDLLNDTDNIDEMALVEALNKFYHKNNESFRELNIKNNKARFEELKDWAMKLYDGVV